MIFWISGMTCEMLDTRILKMYVKFYWTWFWTEKRGWTRRAGANWTAVVFAETVYISIMAIFCTHVCIMLCFNQVLYLSRSCLRNSGIVLEKLYKPIDNNNSWLEWSFLPLGKGIKTVNTELSTDPANYWSSLHLNLNSNWLTCQKKRGLTHIWP